MYVRDQVELAVRLRDETGRVICTFDLSLLDLDPRLAGELLRAHAAEFGHTSVETQKQAFRCIRKLILFLQETRLHYAIPLPESICLDFHRWMASQCLEGSTAQSQQAVIITILRWCARNSKDMIKDGMISQVPSFRRNKPPLPREIDKETVQRVLAACYEEIEGIEKRIECRAEMLRTGAEMPDAIQFASVVDDLMEAGGGKIPTQDIVNRSGKALARRVQLLGGLRAIRSALSITTPDILPFYLAVIVQTGGNPMAVRNILIDCIKPHPLRQDLEFMDWSKPRAHREQRLDFPAGKKWSAPNIVRRLLRLNAALRSECNRIDRDFVFICVTLAPGPPRVPSIQSLHNYLADFIVKYDFPDFDFKDWRALIAKEHWRVGGGIDAARRRLNHTNARMTESYLSSQEFESQHYAAIAEFQGALVSGRWVSDPSGKKGSTLRRKVQSASTVFGFECRDPFGGLDGVSPIGSRCLNFTRCSTCPGAIIPIDDPAVVARILGARAALEDARKRALTQGWSARFMALYADTLRIIDEVILPSITSAVLEKARLLVKPHYIPILE